MSDSVPTAVADEPGVRTYEVEFLDGTTQRYRLPETWKVTFGPIIGAGKDTGTAEAATHRGRHRNGYAFRAWENENKQRLLLTGVIQFRDVSIPMEVRCVRRFGETTWFPDDGSWTGKKAELVQRAWKSTDDPEYADRDPIDPHVDVDEFDPSGFHVVPPPKSRLTAR